MAQLLFQITDDRTRAVSRARSVHSVHEAEEHTTACEGRGADHAPGSGVLRLKLGHTLGDMTHARPRRSRARTAQRLPSAALPSRSCPFRLADAHELPGGYRAVAL